MALIAIFGLWTAAARGRYGGRSSHYMPNRGRVTSLSFTFSNESTRRCDGVAHLVTVDASFFGAWCIFFTAAYRLSGMVAILYYLYYEYSQSGHQSLSTVTVGGLCDTVSYCIVLTSYGWTAADHSFNGWHRTDEDCFSHDARTSLNVLWQRCLAPLSWIITRWPGLIDWVASIILTFHLLWWRFWLSTVWEDFVFLRPYFRSVFTATLSCLSVSCWSSLSLCSMIGPVYSRTASFKVVVVRWILKCEVSSEMSAWYFLER